MLGASRIEAKAVIAVGKVSEIRHDAAAVEERVGLTPGCHRETYNLPKRQQLVEIKQKWQK